MASIDKTPDIRRKEAQIEALEQQLKTKRRTIKTLRTRIEKKREALKKLGNEMMVSMDAVVEKAITLSKDLRRLITELLNHPTIKLDRQQQESVEMLLEGLDTLPWSQVYGLLRGELRMARYRGSGTAATRVI